MWSATGLEPKEVRQPLSSLPVASLFRFFRLTARLPVCFDRPWVGSTFVGTSTVLKLTPSVDGSAEKSGGGSSSIEVLDCLGKKEEMVLFVTVP